MLTTAGYLALPITSLPETLKIVSELDIAAVDLLILNPAWDAAPEILEALQNLQGPVKMIRIESGDRDASDIDAIRSEWIARVERELQWARSADDFS